MKINGLKSFLVVAVSAAIVSSCYPGGPEYIEDYDAVYTIKQPTFDFEDPTRLTYYMPNFVVDISEPGESPNPVGDPQAALNQVAQEMHDLGYTRLTDSLDVEVADYIVTVTVSRSNNYYYNYWYGWGGWYGWGYGGCCYYPPYATVSNIRSGSLLVDIIDRRALDPNNEFLPIPWTGVMQGLYEGSAANINNRALRGISQMFEQSPYLKR